MSDPCATLRVIDSHTEGEPTRVVLPSDPTLTPNQTGPSAAERRAALAADESLRTACVLEPRGYDAVVAAFLYPPRSAAAIAQVVFANNVGPLGMCVHGTIGVAETLRHLGVVSPRARPFRLETPVGDVDFTFDDGGEVVVDNVPSYRSAQAVAVETEDHGTVHGDIAWGGNWFFLCDDHGIPVEPGARAQLESCAKDIMASLARAGFGGTPPSGAAHGGHGTTIDHVELFGPATRDDCGAKNFVLCPGGEWDRSPCGTGTSAKIACLAADKKLRPDEPWGQESLIGTRFGASYTLREDGSIAPRISGRAWITAEATLLMHPNDPFRFGIGSRP